MRSRSAPPRASRSSGGSALLVADLHVMIDGAAALPPGATGAYVFLELGEHSAKSSFVPAASFGPYGEDPYAPSYGHYNAGWPPPHAGFTLNPTDTCAMRPRSCLQAASELRPKCPPLTAGLAVDSWQVLAVAGQRRAQPWRVASDV